MIQNKSLNDSWQVTWTDGIHGLRIKEEFYQFPFANDADRYLDINLPVDMNDFMIENGIIEDINVGNNHLLARWVAEQLWQFHKVFFIDEILPDWKYYLIFERLDYKGHIFLNGNLIKIHDNVFVPCKVDVSDLLVIGNNCLVVGLESGIYDTAEKPGQKYQNMIAGSLSKSQWLRKPLYQFGWDWNPILINVGITGDVKLEWIKHNSIDQVSVFHELNQDLDKADFKLKVIFRDGYVGSETHLKINIEDNEWIFPINNLREDNSISHEFTLHNPRLWWPVNYGEQHLYEIEITLLESNETIDRKKIRTGVRRVEIDRSPHPVKGEYFIIKINNIRIFCKGANWVPPDLIYGKSKSKEIEKLIQYASEANFNMLRIWGGGEYATKKLMDLCDENGILIWHDFLFACFKFPGDDPDYLHNLKKDTLWAVRQLSVHPSLVVWCGNNEVQWIYEQAEKKSFEHATDYNIYHKIIPEILKFENCNIPYWPGSPYSPEEIANNASYIGDQHPWQFPLMDKPLDLWTYRQNEDRFPNEGGVLGVSPLKTLNDFNLKNQISIRSFVWESHDNTCNFWDNNLGFCYQMLEEWLGIDYKKLNLNEYVFASSLIQAEGLMEYIMNYRCRKFDTSSAIFWMYNDSWPATHSWSIVDYYLRKKPAFYTVKRLFSELFTGLRKTENGISIYVVNDYPQASDIYLKIGIHDTINNVNHVLMNDKVLIEGNTCRELFRIHQKLLPLEKYSSLIPYSIILDDSGNVISQNRLFLKRYKDMHFNPQKIKIEKQNDVFKLSSDTFVWAACTDLSGDEVPDNFFDLIPGETYLFQLKDKNRSFELKSSGNQLLINSTD